MAWIDDRELFGPGVVGTIEVIRVTLQVLEAITVYEVRRLRYIW